MACWRESKEKWFRDGRSKLADASPLTTQRAWLHTADRSGTRTTKRWQTTVLTEPLSKGYILQRNCKFSNGTVNFWNGSNSGRKRLFDVFFFSYKEQGVAESHGARIVVVGSREGAHQRFFLFPFIKHAVLNGQTAHTKGCLENRCVVELDVVRKKKN